MPTDMNQGEPAGPHQTEEEEKRTARAFDQAIKRISKKKSLKLRISKRLPWLVVFFVFAAVSGLGCFAFLDRPPQNATFTGSLDIDTQLTVHVPNDKAHSLEGRTISGLKLYSIGRPIRLELPMESGNLTLLAQALGSEWAGKPIKKDYLSFELNFTNPVEVNVKVEQVDELSISRKLADEGGGAIIQTNISQLQLPVQDEPTIVVTVNPGKADFRIKKSDQEVPGQFSLRSAPVSDPNEPSIFTMDMDRAAEIPEERSCEIWLEYNPEADFTANIYGIWADARYASEAVLTMGATSGSATYKPSKGERLKIFFERLQLVNIQENRIFIENAHVSSALLNTVVELLPRMFNTWPDWGRSLWTAFAFSTGVPTLLQILRKVKLWPS